MRATLPGLLLGLFCAGPAMAGFEHCNTLQRAALAGAVKGAGAALELAKIAVEPDNPSYEKWFGPWSAKRGELVRDRISAISSKMRLATIHFYCASNGEEDCTSEQYANVDPGDPYVIYICPGFYKLPGLAGLAEVEAEEYGTRDGTLIHEMSHFTTVASTEDGCYGRQECAAFAEFHPRAAITNADAYEYFVEDSAVGLVRAGK